MIQAVNPLYNSTNMDVKLSRKKWLYREWEVSLPAGRFRVVYSGYGSGFESISIDDVIVVKTRSVFWFVRKFEFSIGDLPATVQVRVWPWLTLRAIRLTIEDKVCYSEGF